jgi:hypothetical protein
MRPGGGWRSPRRPVSWSAAAPPDAPARADPRPVADLKSEHVDPGLVPGIAAVSAVSLIGGASLGPEKALGAMGGGAGTWFARRRALGNEDSQVNTLVGFTGAYGGLFSSTVIVMMLILEAARPGGHGRLPDPGGSAPDRTNPDRRHHRTPHHGGHGISRYHSQTVARSRGEPTSLAERAQHRRTAIPTPRPTATGSCSRATGATPTCAAPTCTSCARTQARCPHDAPDRPTDRPTTTGRRCGRLARSGRGRGPGGEAAVSSSQPPSTR